VSSIQELEELTGAKVREGRLTGRQAGAVELASRTEPGDELK
jgi:hypothetical protein